MDRKKVSSSPRNRPDNALHETGAPDRKREDGPARRALVAGLRAGLQFPLPVLCQEPRHPQEDAPQPAPAEGLAVLLSDAARGRMADPCAARPKAQGRSSKAGRSTCAAFPSSLSRRTGSLRRCRARRWPCTCASRRRRASTSIPNVMSAATPGASPTASATATGSGTTSATGLRNQVFQSWSRLRFHLRFRCGSGPDSGRPVHPRAARAGDHFQKTHLTQPAVPAAGT